MGTSLHGAGSARKRPGASQRGPRRTVALATGLGAGGAVGATVPVTSLF
jgi:hypothetical protein